MLRQKDLKSQARRKATERRGNKHERRQRERRDSKSEGNGIKKERRKDWGEKRDRFGSVHTNTHELTPFNHQQPSFFL